MPLPDSAILNIDISHQVVNKHFLFLNKKAATTFQALITINSINMSWGHHLQAFIPPLTSKLSSLANSYGLTSFLLIPVLTLVQALRASHVNQKNDILSKLPCFLHPIQLQKSSTSYSSYHALLLLLTKSNLNSSFGQQDCSSDFIP